MFQFKSIAHQTTFLVGRMQEVEYRILMWTLTPELRKRAVAREKGWGAPAPKPNLREPAG